MKNWIKLIIGIQLIAIIFLGYQNYSLTQSNQQLNAAMETARIEVENATKESEKMASLASAARMKAEENVIKLKQALTDCQ